MSLSEDSRFLLPTKPRTNANGERAWSGRLHALLDGAAREAGVPVAVILGYRRQPAIVLARQRAMRVAFEEGFSSPQIGRVFNRDHTTVLYAAGVLSGKRPGGLQ